MTYLFAMCAVVGVLLLFGIFCVACAISKELRTQRDTLHTILHVLRDLRMPDVTRLSVEILKRFKGVL